MAACHAIIALVILCLAHDVTGTGVVIGEKLYVGCFKYFRSRSYDARTLDKCIKSCQTNAFYFAAIKNELECHCGNSLGGDKVATKECQKPNHYTVYAVVPSYLGCFGVELRRQFTNVTVHNGMTNDYCIENCRLNNYRNAATQSKSMCFCGNIYGKARKSDKCTVPCNGNNSQICGGLLANSVYSANHLPGLMMYYFEVFHCEFGSDILGYCSKSKCKPGWKGSRCHLRDCEFNNGNCGDHECVESQIDGQPVSECLCGKGFRSSSVFEACRDVNECNRNVCGKENRVCVNTFGSFFCQLTNE